MTQAYKLNQPSRCALCVLALLFASSTSEAAELPFPSQTPPSIDAHLYIEAHTVASGSWQTMDSGMNLDVRAFAIYEGDLIAGGAFNQASGQTANFVARWDGSQWQPMGTGMNGWVHALTIYDGDLIAGGGFSTAGGAAANNIARWDGSEWLPVGTGVEGHIAALTVFDGDLIAGAFGELGGRVLRWDGSAWHAMGPVMGGDNSSVRTLVVYEGEMIAGGRFDMAGGTPANNIARWDGETWQPIGSGMSGVDFPRVNSLIVQDGDLVAGGGFSTAGGAAANNIARWDGSEWQPVGTGTSGGYFDGAVYGLLVFEDDLIAGGGFDTAGGTTANNIARWDGDAWQAIGDGMGGGWFDGAVFAVTSFGNDLIAGGDFTTAEGQTVNHVALWQGAEVSTDPNAAPVQALELSPAYPNPFTGTTTISFTLAQPEPIRLEAYDLLGRRVEVLIAYEARGAGTHEVTWEPLGLAPGVYVVRLTTGDHRQTRRVLLMR